MGYAVELYACDWADLQAVLGAGDTGFLDAVRRDQGPGLAHLPMAEWDAALRDLLLLPAAQRAGSKSAQAGPETSDAGALAWAAVIRQRGELIGRLQHSSMAGRAFREEFLAKLAPAALSTALDLAALLTSRTLFGLWHAAYPSWGGLTRAEISGLVSAIDMDALPALGDSDDDAWFYALCDALVYAHQAGRDIVSLYL